MITLLFCIGISTGIFLSFLFLIQKIQRIRLLSSYSLPKSPLVLSGIVVVLAGVLDILFLFFYFSGKGLL